MRVPFRLCVRAAVLALALVAPLPGMALAQEPTHVVGQVQDSSTQKPLASVRVTVVGTSVETVTDANGRYALDVPAGRDSLSFRRIGYRPVVRRVEPVVDVAMRFQAVELEAVSVTTALGIEREQRTLPYAAQTISGARLTQVPSTNVLSTLQGNVAGLYVTNSSNPFGSARVVARGGGSILGQNQPLIVVDGIPIDNSAATNRGYGPGAGSSMGGYDVGNAAADINANNIQSVTVLKGPNAAALYGSRASNGAIVVVTKNGRGGPSDGFGVTATFGTTIEKPLRLPDYQNQYGQGFYGEFDFVDGNFGGKNDGADESWGPKLDGRTTGCVMVAGTPAGTSNYDTTKPCHQFFGAGPWAAHPNNVRDFWDNGLVTNVNVAVARSGERNNVRLSVGRTGEAGMYPSNSNTRTDLAITGGTQISNRWSAEASINYINDGMQNQPAQAYEEIDPMQNFIWFGRQVDTRLLKDNLYRNLSDPLTQQILSGNDLRADAPIQYSWNYSYHANPYWEAQVKTTDYSRDRGLGHASVTYKVNDWLSVTGRTGRDWYQNRFRANYPVNNISPFNGGGLLDVGETHSETNSDFLVTGSRPLFKDLTITVNAGGNARVNDLHSSTGIVRKLASPGVYTLQNSDGGITDTLHQEQKKVNSLYGLASFNYKNWLNVDVTGRNDWSSTLPKGNNSIFYPSIGAAFIFTDALRVQSRFLSYGKLRASWTRVGNDTDPYQLRAVYAAGLTPWAGQPSYTAPDRLANPDLKPEQTTGQEIGVDLGLFDEHQQGAVALRRRAAHRRGLVLGCQRHGRFRPAVRQPGGHDVDARRSGPHHRRLDERAADARFAPGRARQLQPRLVGRHHQHAHLQKPEPVVLVRRTAGRSGILGEEVVRPILGHPPGHPAGARARLERPLRGAERRLRERQARHDARASPGLLAQHLLRKRDGYRGRELSEAPRAALGLQHAVVGSAAHRLLAGDHRAGGPQSPALGEATHHRPGDGVRYRQPARRRKRAVAHRAQPRPHSVRAAVSRLGKGERS